MNQGFDPIDARDLQGPSSDEFHRTHGVALETMAGDGPVAQTDNARLLTVK
jgi:hypothetical protein